MPTSDGLCPFATQRPITNSGNFETNRNGQVVKAVVLHIGEGPLTAFFPTFNNPTRKASSHFTVGKKGEIEQYVSINDTAYANGLRWDPALVPQGGWRNPRGIVVTPAWKGLIPAVNPNYYTISIEHEGFFGEAWTEPMYLANLKLLQWVREQTGLEYVRGDTLIGHNDFDNIDRPNCPGPNAPFDRMIADLTAMGGAPHNDSVKRAALVAGANKLGIPLNDQSALAQFALKNKLGIPLSDEFSFTVSGIPYLGQVWSRAVVHVPVGKWDQIEMT